MWMLYAFGSAFFAGITAILAKTGIKTTDSTVATAVRTVVVLAFSWLMVAVTGGFDQIPSISLTSWVFLILSGLATGASWLCYFKALQLGDVNKVVPIDKSSTVITVILAFIIFHETVSALGLAGLVLMTAGTYLMIERRDCESREGSSLWMVYAVMSAVFASLTSILGKIGISGVDSNLGTAIRTLVVLFMAWLMVPVSGKAQQLRHIRPAELVFIALSGIATGASWLCYYRALQEGPASLVAPIDKLSIVVTIAFARVVYKEKLTAASLCGLVMIVAGTLMMLF